MRTKADLDAEDFERSIGGRREYVYDAKTGQPVSYTVKYDFGGCLMPFVIALLLAVYLL